MESTGWFCVVNEQRFATMFVAIVVPVTVLLF